MSCSRLAGAGIILLTFFPATGVVCQDRGFGLGIILGDPTGVSFKSWNDIEHAIDGAVAWSFVDNEYIQFHADFLHHTAREIPVEKGRLVFYYGIGGLIRLWEDRDTLLGGRVPLGLNWQFDENHLDAFVELVPILFLTPATDFELGAAVGVRYFF